MHPPLTIDSEGGYEVQYHREYVHSSSVTGSPNTDSTAPLWRSPTVHMRSSRGAYVSVLRAKGFCFQSDGNESPRFSLNSLSIRFPPSDREHVQRERERDSQQRGNGDKLHLQIAFPNWICIRTDSERIRMVIAKGTWTEIECDDLKNRVKSEQNQREI